MNKWRKHETRRGRRCDGKPKGIGGGSLRERKVKGVKGEGCGLVDAGSEGVVRGGLRPQHLGDADKPEAKEEDAGQETCARGSTSDRHWGS